MDRKFRMRFLNSLSDNPKSKIQNLKRLALGAMLALAYPVVSADHKR